MAIKGLSVNVRIEIYLVGDLGYKYTINCFRERRVVVVLSRTSLDRQDAVPVQSLSEFLKGYGDVIQSSASECVASDGH